MITIAIGTTRAPKIDGVKEGFSVCAEKFPALQDEICWITEASDSGISDMPLSLEEVLTGAKNRAESLKNKWIEADYYIGTEGGVSKIFGKSFLFGTVYILHKSGEAHMGISPMIEVPEKIDHLLYAEKQELGPVMDSLSGMVDIRSQNGSMGAWSNDMFTRADEFAVATKSAMSPFFNTYYSL